MKTKIFAYNGVLGIDTNVDVEGLINDPKDGHQLGMVIRTDAIEITKEAKEYIKGAERERGSFAPMMLTKHADPSDKFGKSSFGIMGFGKSAIKRENITIGRDCEISILEDMIETEIEIPEDFKNFVDSNL